MPARKLRWRKDGARDIPIEDAIWQWILDHAAKRPDGTLLVRAGVKDREHFFESLTARVEGRYRFMEDELPINNK